MDCLTFLKVCLLFPVPLETLLGFQLQIHAWFHSSMYQRMVLCTCGSFRETAGVPYEGQAPAALTVRQLLCDYVHGTFFYKNKSK